MEEGNKILCFEFKKKNFYPEMSLQIEGENRKPANQEKEKSAGQLWSQEGKKKKQQERILWPDSEKKCDKLNGKHTNTEKRNGKQKSVTKFC